MKIHLPAPLRSHRRNAGDGRLDARSGSSRSTRNAPFSLGTGALAAGALFAGALIVTSTPGARAGTFDPVAAQTPAPQDKNTEFRQKFRQALEINAKEEIAKLVRTYQEQATELALELCRTISAGGSDRAEKEVAALREGWRTSFKSGFIENIYNYYSLLDPRTARELERLDREYEAGFKKWTANQTAKDQAVFEMLAGQYDTLGKAYRELGHQLYAARSFILAGNCVDSDVRGPAADLNRAADLYGECVRACEAFEYNAGWALTVKARFEQLTREGKGAAAGKASGDAPTGPTAEPVKNAAGGPLIAPMHFEAVAFDAFRRPSYFLDDIAILWPIVYLREKGTSGGFQALENSRAKVLRLGAAALSLDVDGDGKGEVNVPTSGNKALLQFEIGEGDAKRPWAVVTEVGSDKEMYQGVQVNYQANDQQFQLYVMNAASLVGTLNGIPVRVFDDNMDGIYGSMPKSWQYVGLTEGQLQPDIDCYVLGAEKHARPWTQYGEIGGAWYEFEPQKGGVEFKAVPTTFPTGKLKLDYKGEMPECVILKGEGPYEKTYIDLLQNGGAEVDVPAGSYKLYFGIVRKGKKQQTMKALMLPGKRTPAWTVEAGKTAVVQLGGPFGFDFATEIKEDKLEVKGPSIVVVGMRSDERYERLWNCVPRPELSWRKAGSKKGSKPERLGVVEDLNAEDENGKRLHEAADTFHPLGLSVELKLKEGESAEVQLVDKKNKLFGSIESAWLK